jgi:ferredoxin
LERIEIEKEAEVEEAIQDEIDRQLSAEQEMTAAMAIAENVLNKALQNAERAKADLVRCVGRLACGPCVVIVLSDL